MNIETLKITIMERFNPVTEPLKMEFFSIEDDGRGGKQIHVLGFLYTNGEDYGEGEWRNVEYAGFIEPLEDFIKNYAETENYVDYTAEGLNQYIGDCTDGEALEIINRYFGGHPADYVLHYSEITMDTPCGDYAFEFLHVGDGKPDNRTDLDKAIDYVRENMEADELAEIRAQVDRSYRYHMAPSDCVANDSKVIDLLEEYGDNEGLPEGWWMEHGDIDDWLLKL